MISARGQGGKGRAALVAPSNYVAHLARASDGLEIVALAPTEIEGQVVAQPGPPLKRAELERLAHVLRENLVPFSCRVRPTLGSRQVVERVEGLIRRQSDVRALHEKSGFAAAWPEIASRVEIPEPLGGQLTVMDKVRPTLFSQALLGGYLAALLAWELRLPLEDRVSVFVAGLLRDLGMLYLDHRILDDPSDQHFDGDAWTEVQTHVVLSHRILELSGAPVGVGQAVLCHHERSDSTGYPRALYGDDLPLLGQLVGFADIASTLRVKRFLGSGRNLRDTLTVLQLNTDGFDERISRAYVDLLERTKMKPTAFCPHDRETMLRILKRRATTIRTSMLQLKEVADDRRARHRTSRGHILRSSVERMLSTLQRSGHGDQDFVWWLGLVAAGKESADMHQLAEIDLQQVELLWQLRRVRQELFKAVPSLGLRRSAVSI